MQETASAAPLVQRPLKKGTVIEYCDIEAVIVEDTGDSRITVLCEDTIQRWFWTFEGVSCKVISTPAEEPQGS